MRQIVIDRKYQIASRNAGEVNLSALKPSPSTRSRIYAVRNSFWGLKRTNRKLGTLSTSIRRSTTSGSSMSTKWCDCEPKLPRARGAQRHSASYKPPGTAVSPTRATKASPAPGWAIGNNGDAGSCRMAGRWRALGFGRYWALRRQPLDVIFLQPHGEHSVFSLRMSDRLVPQEILPTAENWIIVDS